MQWRKQSGKLVAEMIATGCREFKSAPSLEHLYRVKEKSMSLLSALFGKKTRPASKTPRRTVRLGVEQLDERLVPSTVATGPDGTTYAIFGNGRELWGQHPNGSWTGDLVNAVSQVAVSRTGVIDILNTYGILAQELPGQSSFHTLVAGGGQINAIAAGSGSDVFVNWYSDRELWQLDANGNWQYQHATNVMDIGDYGAAIVDGNGALKVNMGNYNWQTIVGSGCHAVGSGTYYGEILFTWGPNYQLYGVGNAGQSNQYFDYSLNYINNVVQISCYDNWSPNWGSPYSPALHQFNYVSGGGAVMEYSNLYGDGLVYTDAWTY
jgi:hypothetical protein